MARAYSSIVICCLILGYLPPLDFQKKITEERNCCFNYSETAQVSAYIMKCACDIFFALILFALSFKPILAMNQSASHDEQRISLSIKNNFTNVPGEHTRLSPLPGSRHHELQEIKRYKKIFQFYQEETYSKQNLYVIPIAHRERADVISKNIFIDYISKYHKYGINIDNVVGWNSVDLNKTDVSDLENEHNTWNIRAKVSEPSSKSHIENFMYRPAYIVAYHETMHLEEAIVGISQADFNSQDTDVCEVLTVTKTLILLDRVYKETLQIPLDQIVDYGVTFEIFGKKIPQGLLAKFYGDLEPKYENLAEALTSKESLDFLGYLSYVASIMGNSCEEQQSDAPKCLPVLGSAAWPIFGNVLLMSSTQGKGLLRVKTLQKEESNLFEYIGNNEEQTKKGLRQQFEMACIFGDLERLNATLQKVKVNEQYNFISEGSGSSKATGLHMAAEFGHEAIVKILLKVAEEADAIEDFLKKTNFIDRTALELARKQNRTSIIELLEAYNLDL